MTPQEQEMIDGLISRIRGTQVQDKDTAAEQRIQQGLAGYPDGLYVLAQTVLVQQYGLGQAQSQIDDLKHQNAALQDQLQHTASQAKSTGGSFLSHIFGSDPSQVAPTSQQAQQPPPPYGNVNTGGPQPVYPSPPYPGQGYPPAGYPPAGYPAPGGGGMFGGGGGGGFLQGALQTAAGVAAGEVAFQGIEDLFHGFGGGGQGRGFGGGGFGGGGGETVVNNYYDDDNRGGGGGDAKRDTGNFYNPSDDASRGNGSDTAQFADTNDDNSNDTSGFDDSSSFDDGGTDDNNSSF